MELTDADGGEQELLAKPDRIRPAPAESSARSPQTTRKELLAYYLFTAGDNGITHLCFGAVAFQSLLDQASDENGLLYFAGARRNVESTALLANGISFTIQAILFIILGGYADFGTLRPKICIFWCIVGFATGFAWLWVYEPEQWKIGIVLYAIGLLTFEMSNVYWNAAFPGLARDSAKLREAANLMNEGSITREKYEEQDMMERSKISTTAFTFQSFGGAATLVVVSLFIYMFDFERTQARNSWGLSVIMAFTTAVWLVLALPWFFFEQKRPGQTVPRDMSILRAGMHQLKEAAANILLLKQSLLYLICFFLLSDALNTSFVVFSALEYKIVQFRTSLVTNMLLISLVAQGIGTYLFFLLQRKLRYTTKQMLGIIIFSLVLMNAWGMVGNFTSSFGFHQVWEVWLWQVYFGFLVCPWWTYGFIMVSSVTPRGYESMFFSIFGVAGKTSSLMGPFITSAIVRMTPGENKDWAPFYFLFALSAVSGIVFWIFMDERASAAEQELFLSTRNLDTRKETGYDAVELSNLVSDSERSSFDE